MTWKLDHCIHGKPLTAQCPDCADENARMTVQKAEALAAAEYNAAYVKTCLLTLAATVARVVDFGEPLTEGLQEDLRILLNSVRHEQKKLRTDDPEWRAGRCPCCWCQEETT